MASNRQQLAVLAGLLLVLAVVLWWQTGQTVPLPPPTGAGAAAVELAAVPAPATATRPATARRPTEKVPEVALSRLSSERPAVNDTGRDPFRFGASPRRGAEAAPAPRPDSDLQGRPVPSMPPGAGMPGAAGPAAVPPIGLKFIGIVKRSQAGVVLAVLSDGRGVYYGAEGDVIEGRYRILKIGAESIEMSYVDGRGQQRIPLTGA